MFRDPNDLFTAKHWLQVLYMLPAIIGLLWLRVTKSKGRMPQIVFVLSLLYGLLMYFFVVHKM